MNHSKSSSRIVWYNPLLSLFPSLPEVNLLICYDMNSLNWMCPTQWLYFTKRIKMWPLLSNYLLSPYGWIIDELRVASIANLMSSCCALITLLQASQMVLFPFRVIIIILIKRLCFEFDQVELIIDFFFLFLTHPYLINIIFQRLFKKSHESLIFCFVLIWFDFLISHETNLICSPFLSSI